MLSLFLAVVLAQSPPPAEATDAEVRERTYEAQAHWRDGRLEEAVEAYTRVLDAAPDEMWQANALGARANILLQLERPDEALDDARRYAELFPNATYALELQERALEQLGRDDEAAEVRTRIDEIEARYGLSSGWDADPLSDLVVVALQAVTIGLTVAVGILILLTINAAIGRRQKREGRGTWLRLFWVTGLVTVMQLLPFAMCWVMTAAGTTERPASDFVATAIVIGGINLLFLFTAMGPAVRFVHSKDPLPLVEDEALLARVAELSKDMRLTTPVVRLLPTGGGELQAQAFAGGLVALSLVVGDGILHRLSPEERDATLGHELAHIANRSLWWLTVVLPIAATAAVVMAGWFSTGLAIAFGFTLWIGLRHLVSRYFEYDCDRRAAEAIGFRTTYSALAKIHAANLLRDTGWLSFLVYATATHPSRAQRLAALHAAAPDDDRPAATWSAEDLRHRHRAGQTAVVCWLASLVAIPLWARAQPDSYWPAVVLGVIGAIPWIAIITASRQATKDARRRMVERGRRRRTVLIVVAAAFVLWVVLMNPFADSIRELRDAGERTTRIVLLLTVLMSCLFLIVVCFRSFIGGVSSRSHVQQVAIAMQTRNFDKVFELAKAHPRAFEKSAMLRHNLGFAAAITGRRDQAVEVLEGLRRNEPGYSESVIVLAMTHLDEGRPEEALRLIEEVQQKLPNDPTPLMLRGRVLRELGRLDEAQECVDRALELKPDSGNTYAVAAWTALDRGDREQAQALLETAEEHDPATAFIEYVKAQVALAGDDPDAAREQVERAVAASDANPYSLLQNQVRTLADRTPSSDRDLV